MFHVAPFLGKKKAYKSKNHAYHKGKWKLDRWGGPVGKSACSSSDFRTSATAQICAHAHKYTIKKTSQNKQSSKLYLITNRKPPILWCFCSFSLSPTASIYCSSLYLVTKSTDVTFLFIDGQRDSKGSVSVPCCFRHPGQEDTASHMQGSCWLRRVSPLLLAVAYLCLPSTAQNHNRLLFV